MQFAGGAESVGAARRLALHLLAGWGLEDLEWTVTQIVSELATNAVIHARTDFAVTITASGPGVRIEVRDQSPKPPLPRHYDTEATTGRGLRLVAQMSRAWGVEQHSDGKTVWAEIALTLADTTGIAAEELLAMFDDDPNAASATPPHQPTGSAMAQRPSRRVLEACAR
jgi:anti-sigma regulatory factor (Ser/Thr protein kinase)